MFSKKSTLFVLIIILAALLILAGCKSRGATDDYVDTSGGQPAAQPEQTPEPTPTPTPEQFEEPVVKVPNKIYDEEAINKTADKLGQNQVDKIKNVANNNNTSVAIASEDGVAYLKGNDKIIFSIEVIPPQPNLESEYYLTTYAEDFEQALPYFREVYSASAKSQAIDEAVNTHAGNVNQLGRSGLPYDKTTLTGEDKVEVRCIATVDEALGSGKIMISFSIRVAK